jgi:predicted nucleotidyltransferase
MRRQPMKAREGDIITDSNGTIFDVKGLVHPSSKIIAFPRFIPDPRGKRVRENLKYTKVYSFSERFQFLEQKYPHYIVYDSVFDEKLCEMPLEDVKRHYKPVNRLRELRRSEDLDALERDAAEFMELMKSHANVPWNTMGISGSLLVKLHTPKSDIDPIVYGSRSCHKIYESLKCLTHELKSHLEAYSTGELHELFKFRVKDTQVSFKDFVRTESRKVLQGRFRNREYFIRFVKDWSEIDEKYGEILYKNVGYAKIKAVIEDDSEAIFTPCSYKINNVEILEGARFTVEEIASFRGRFCEQARKGEVVFAQGKVERVMDSRQDREFFRLLLGNKPSDFMILG